MKLTLNGEETLYEQEMTLQELLDRLAIPGGRVACELNLKIIKRAFYGTTILKDGDTIEIIQAIGGG